MVINPEAPFDQSRVPERSWGGLISTLLVLAFIVVLIAMCSFTAVKVAHSHDLTGQYANSSLKPWFDRLASAKGLCCSFADGRSVDDPDWGTNAQGYWVVVDGKKINVPDAAVVTEPNKFGPAVVWPYLENGEPAIRCFLPGGGA